jgi:Restriction endonuclease BglII
VPAIRSISSALDRKFATYDWRNALTVLQNAHPEEWSDILAVLDSFELRFSHPTAKGRGNKSEIAGQLDGALYKRGWVEKTFNTAVVVDGVQRPTPTHSVDCFTGRVALEVDSLANTQ